MNPAQVSQRYYHSPADYSVTKTNADKIGRQDCGSAPPDTTDMSGSNRDTDRPSTASKPHGDKPNTTSPPNVGDLPSDAPQSPQIARSQQDYLWAQQAQYAQWEQHSQMWARYYQQTAQPGGPQLRPYTYGMQQQAFAHPRENLGYGMSAQLQYDNFRKQQAKVQRVNNRRRAFVPSEHSRSPAQVQAMGPGVGKPHNRETNAREQSERKTKGKTKAKEPKIMLPAPEPSAQYILRAMEKAEVIDPPDLKLVILDLNGTLLYRPNARKQPTMMIGRPFLQQFLQYLFENFAVMIWSSAKPQNVKILVECGLKDYGSKLVATWARDTLGLADHHYSMNVQCYKDLQRVWVSDEVQRNMRGYESGKRFDQRNTILIDDSALKAAAQPHNLLEIPEFDGSSPDEMKQDVLGEVAGYLELLKMQEDVSKFIYKTPFKADGTWIFDWQYLFPACADEAADGRVLKPVILGDE